MATVGQQLTAPESGWQRFDNANSKISYVGNWVDNGSSSTYASTSKYTSDNTSSIKIRFYGTKIRLISLMNPDRNQGQITIDGVAETFSENAATNNFQSLVYEKTGLSLGMHTVIIQKVSGTYLDFDALDIDDTGYLTTPIGGNLSAPESGWKRYDDTMPQFKYSGTGWSVGTNASNYNSTEHETHTANDSFSFSFSGTKLRIISVVNNDATYSGSASVNVTIDGVTETFSANAPLQYQTLTYEKTGLASGVHTVTIKVPDAKYYWFDAIDIDSTGRLLHPDEVTDIKNLTIGKRIRAHYKAATSGAIGFFSNIGQETYKDGKNDFIPTASSATPDGDFYILYVDDDNRGKKMMIADRNVQHSISWDALDTGGIASGSGSPTYIQDLNNNILVGATFTASSTYSTNTPDKALAGSSGYWNGGGYSGWWKADLGSIKSFSNLYLNPSNGNQVHILISNDDINYSEVATFMGAGMLKNLSFPTVQARYIKIVIDSGANWVAISSLSIDNNGAPKYNFIARLLTGGTTSSDTDDEWDNYVVKSTIGGLITAGDNNIWNWSSAYTWTSSVNTYGSAYRTLRGHDAVSTSGYNATNVTGNGSILYGFRPMILIETIPVPITNKYLFQDGTDIKKYSSGSWSTIGVAPVTKTMFDTDGMTDLSVITSSVIQALTSTNPEVLCWTDEVPTAPATVSRRATLTAVPVPQLLLPTGDISISSLQSVSLNSTLSGSSDLKVIVSADSGATWKGKSVVNPSDLSAVKANGYTPSELNALTSNQLVSLFPNGKARFAFYLEQSATTDTVQVNSLSINDAQYIITPIMDSLSILYEVLVSEKPALYVSRDDGITWKQVQTDELTSLSDLPSGNQLRVKAVLSNGQELHGLSYSWI